MKWLIISLWCYLGNNLVFCAGLRSNKLLFAKWLRGMFRLHLGCANTQWTSGFVSQGPCPDEWRTTTKLEMTWPPLLGIEPESLDLKPEHLPLLTPLCCRCVSWYPCKRKNWGHKQQVYIKRAEYCAMVVLQISCFISYWLCKFQFFMRLVLAELCGRVVNCC